MLRIDDTSKTLVPPRPGTLKTESLRERQDLQELIVNSWDVVAGELGFPDLRLLGKEIIPHASCADRIDILAFDETDGRPAIIELKRDRSRLHLLQGLSYAGMVDTWTTADYARLLEGNDDEDLRNSIEARDATASPAVILIAEQFEPEVILAANWLHSKHEVDIYCFSLKLFGFGEDLHLTVQRDFPLQGLEDLYRARRQVSTQTSKQSWEDVKGWVRFEWGPAMIDRCLSTGGNNSPDKRYFATPFAGAWGSYMFYVNRQGAMARFHSRREGDVEYWQSAIDGASVSTWGNENTAEGISIPITGAEQLDQFIAGLESLPETEVESTDGSIA